MGKAQFQEKLQSPKQKSVLIEGDDIYHQVIGWYVQAWKEENHLDVFWKVCINTIKTYLEDGYDVIFNYIVTHISLKQTQEKFKDYDVKFIVLLVKDFILEQLDLLDNITCKGLPNKK